MLQKKMRAEHEEKDRQEHDVEQRENYQPAEMVIFCASQFHARSTGSSNSAAAPSDASCASNLLHYRSCRASRSRAAASSGCWKLIIPLIGRLSVNMRTISIPARSMSGSIVFTRDDR